jgi:hypothetical protein
MPSKKIYFYIPGAESLNFLYFLAERYGSALIVITPSISVKEICNILELAYIQPVFYDFSEKSNTSLGSWYLKNNWCSSFFRGFCCKIHELFCMTVKMVKAKKMVDSLCPGATLYYSTFFYDVPGILFLGFLIRSKKTIVKLVWSNNLMKFDKVEHPSLFSIASYLNFFIPNLFAFHLDPAFGRIIGVNPDYLRARGLEFFYRDEKIECTLQDKYKKKALSLLKIKAAEKPRVLFLGDYSIENGISFYGDTYLDVLNLLGEIGTIDTYYKPHPLYHSITHSALRNLNVLDTQIPVEFLDDGSWEYIISYATAALTTRKLSKCICLLKLEELETKAFDVPEFLKLLEEVDNQIIYPENLSSLKLLLRSCVP